ncbi:MAG TPA: hypothetical protein VJM11_01965 [Nevskiaceae bacterium]|nr:hypothetical protein [Nevskiaceae bacterium]
MYRRTIFSLAIANAFASAGAFAQTALGPVFPVSEPTTVEALHPGIDAAPDGAFVAVWQYRTPSGGPLSENREIHARRFGPRGVPVGEEFVVNSVETGQQEQPRVAMNADGDFAVVWRDRSDSYTPDYGVFARRYRADGSPRGRHFRVHERVNGSQQDGRIAIDGDGAVVVTWRKFFSTDQQRNNDVYARCFAPNGEPLATEFVVGDVTTGGQHSPAIAMNDGGRFVIAWADWQNQAYDILAQRYDSDCETIGEPIVVAHAGSGSTFYKHDPAVAIDEDGDFVVGWASHDQDGDRYGVYARRYRGDGVPRGEEFRVNTVTTGDQRNTEVACDATGNFVVSWTARGEDGNYQDGKPSVWARRYDRRGDPQGKPFRVHPASEVLRTQQDVAMDADGDIVVAWLGKLENNWYGIEARRFQGFGSVDLQLNQFDTPDPIGALGPVTYTLKVGNLTPPSTATGEEDIDRAIGSATNVRVVAKLPPGSSNVQTAGENWSCAVDGDIADCDYTRLLRAGANAPPLEITVSTGGIAEPTISNVGKVSADQADPRPVNNRDVETTAFQN